MKKEKIKNPRQIKNIIFRIFLIILAILIYNLHLPDLQKSPRQRDIKVYGKAEPTVFEITYGNEQQ